jgi:predicted RNA polymerase sigma factor
VRRFAPLSAHDTVVDAETNLIVRATIDRLPPRQRQILQLRGVDGLEMGQVAEVLDVGISTAKVALHRARRRLESALAPGLLPNPRARRVASLPGRVASTPLEAAASSQRAATVSRAM